MTFLYSLREAFSQLAPEFLYHTFFFFSLWKRKDFPLPSEYCFIWQKVRSSFYHVQYFMRSLESFRYSLCFRTEREKTQPHAFVPRENAFFLVKCLSQLLEHPSTFSPFHININLKVQLPWIPSQGWRQYERIKASISGLSGIAFPEPGLVMQNPAVHLLLSLKRCLLAGLWSSWDTAKLKNSIPFFCLKGRGCWESRLGFIYRSLRDQSVRSFGACLMGWASWRCNGCFLPKHSWRGGSSASMPNARTRTHAHQMQHQMFRALSPPEMWNVTLSSAWKNLWTLTNFQSFNIGFC